MTKKKFCKMCGLPLKRGANFCNVCGAEVIGTKYCYECGAKLKKKDLFCSECGEITELGKVLSKRFSDINDYEIWEDSEECSGHALDDCCNDEEEEEEKKCPFFDEMDFGCEFCETMDFLRCEKVTKTYKDNKRLVKADKLPKKPKEPEEKNEDDYRDPDLKVVEDMGFYTHGCVLDKVTLNTNKYYYYAKQYGNVINRIDRNMRGSYVDIDVSSNTPDHRRIEGMTILDGLLAVLVSICKSDTVFYHLDYYSPDLEFIKSERLVELDFLGEGYSSRKYAKMCAMDSDSIMIYIKEFDKYNSEYRPIDVFIVYYNFSDKSVYLVGVDRDSINDKELNEDCMISSIDKIYKHMTNTYFVFSTYKNLKYGGYITNKLLVKYDKELDNIEVIWNKNRDGEIPLFFDFERNIMWTFVTKTECYNYNLSVRRTVKYLCARRISSNCTILEEFGFREVPYKNSKNLIYFDNNFLCSVSPIRELIVITKDGNRVVWPENQISDVEELVFWEDKVIGKLVGDEGCHWWFKRIKYEYGGKVEKVLDF